MLFQSLNKTKQSSVVISMILMALGLVMIICPAQYTSSLIDALGFCLLILSLVMIMDYMISKKVLFNVVKLTMAIVLGLVGLAVLVFDDSILKILGWVFGVVLRFFTPGAFPDLRTAPAAAFGYLFFAAVCIAVPRIAMTARLLRAQAREELKKDYVRASRARGASLSQALAAHALKNALVPTIAFLGQTMAEIVGAGIVVEQVFAVPGLGRLLVASVSNRDYPVVMAAVVLLAFGVTAVGTAADLINQAVDPRLRLGGRAA